MFGGKRKASNAGTVPQWDDPTSPAATALEPAEPEGHADELEPEPAPTRRFGWVLPLLAMALALGADAALIALSWPKLAGVEPFELAQFIALLCLPPALVGVIYLLALRTSSAEARRWGTTARAMRAEAAALEHTVAGLARRIQENRAALGEQAAMLAAMTETAANRLGVAAETMRERADTVTSSARILGDAAAGAERSVEFVLASLPKAQDEIRDLAARIETIGQDAGARATALDTQLSALAERGREAGSVAGGAAERLAANLARMESTSETASARLERVAAEMSSTVDNVLDRAARAVDEARKGITAQGEAMLAMLNTSQATLDRAGHEGADALGERIGNIETAIGRISLRLAEEQVRSDLLVSGLTAGIDRVETDFAGLHERGTQRSQTLAASVSALSESFAAMRDSLADGDAHAKAVIGTAEALLVALDASTREIDETMPGALARLDKRIGESRRVVAAAKPELLALVTAAESTHDAIEAIADVVTQQRDTLARTSDALIATLKTGKAEAGTLEVIVESTVAAARRFAEQGAPQLVDALVRVRETAVASADEARAALEDVVPDAARALEHASIAALRHAVDASVRSQLGELAETTEAAMTAAARASERLTQQMLALTEATAQVEDRIDSARARHEANDADSFARRVSLLIEALNSVSIDITKAFSQEVSDSAWSAYLKGDRGVFTRRAVKLLEHGESREIARLYDSDESFREQVNRYVHDFEAMLRQILALRDGAPMSVTLISSDMGKLYVVLAQSIERLRS